MAPVQFQWYPADSIPDYRVDERQISSMTSFNRIDSKRGDGDSGGWVTARDRMVTRQSGHTRGRSMKKLVAIVIAAVVAISIVAYFASSGDTALSRISQSEQSPTPAAEPPRAGNSHESSDAESAATIAAPVTDEQKLAACGVIMTRRAEHDSAMLAAEPKDPAWAYPMEQKLREFTSRRFQSSEINVVAVDCRTYYCNIKAQTFDAEKTAKEFAEGIGALHEEAWSGEFRGSGSWYEEEEGKVFHVARLNRPRPAEVPRMMMRDDPGEASLLSECAAIREGQERQRRATRDRQERDAGWADPMEYHLREYMTAHLSKHPVDHLDIDCRKTFCRLQASGRTKESQTAFQKTAENASKESWANLWYAEVTGHAENGAWDGSVVLYRRNSQ